VSGLAKAPIGSFSSLFRQIGWLAEARCGKLYLWADREAREVLKWRAWPVFTLSHERGVVASMRGLLLTVAPSTAQDASTFVQSFLPMDDAYSTSVEALATLRLLCPFGKYCT